MMGSRGYHIVYCTPALYSAGGVERVVSVKASCLAEVYGCDVTIIVTEGRGKPPFFPLSPKVKVVNLGLDFEELWHQPFVKKALLYLKKRRCYKRLLKAELLRIRPDITISTLRREINFLNGIRDGSRKIGELHVNRRNFRNFEANERNVVKDIIAKVWMRNLVGHLKHLDRLVVLTEKERRQWPELSRVGVIPDPVSIQCPTPSSLVQKRVITIGRYAYQKGYDLLLEVWAEVEKRCPDWELSVYGMGDRATYQAMADRLGIDASRCLLRGSLDDVAGRLAESSLFVLPSRFEGFGMVIVEAMACGLPVVAFDCEDGPRSIISDGTDGFLVEPGDLQGFAEKMLLLMRDADLRRRMGRAALEKARQFSMEKIVGQWKQLFDELMGEA